MKEILEETSSNYEIYVYVIEHTCVIRSYTSILKTAILKSLGIIMFYQICTRYYIIIGIFIIQIGQNDQSLLIIFLGNFSKQSII